MFCPMTGTPSPLLPAEESYLSSRRVHARGERDYRMGRHCARGALSQLGVYDFPVVNADRREPVWPPSITGSFTHCDLLAGAAAVERQYARGVGLDVERRDRRLGEIAAKVTTARERATRPDGLPLAVLVFQRQGTRAKASWRSYGRDVRMSAYLVRRTPPPTPICKPPGRSSPMWTSRPIRARLSTRLRRSCATFHPAPSRSCSSTRRAGGSTCDGLQGF
ncbi:MAG: hypothetical protein J7528_21100 [Caulobacter sp.]|nr:hypothetical protein [Caulobacter sp.]